MPEGYSVWHHGETEHVVGHGPNGWESAITWDRWQARRWCVEHSKQQRRME